LILLIGIEGAYGHVWYNNNNLAKTSSITAKTVSHPRTISQPFRGHIENISKPSARFYGPTFTKETTGLRVTVMLSNSSVKVGDVLWIKVKLVGEKAHDINHLRFSIINSRGQIVYDTYVFLPHRTLTPGASTPQEEAYNIAWKALKHPSGNTEITPGKYTFIIKIGVGNNEVLLQGLVNVVK
jgi:hypothetical protein